MLSKLQNIPLNDPCTDSCSLEIPESEITIIDHTLTSRIKLFYVDIGENGIFEDSTDFLPPKPYCNDDNGIRVRFLWVIRPNLKDKSVRKNLKVTLSAKLLRSRYFEGLTKSNIADAYNYLMSLNVFKCSYEAFLDSSISDIDVCKNSRMNPKHFHRSLNNVKNQCSAGKTKHFSDVFAKKNLVGKYINVGLEIVSRASAKASTPYVKFYHKQLELESKKSIEFYNNFLMRFNIKELIRTEVTLKGYHHKKRLSKNISFPDFKTLREWLDISKNTLSRFFHYSINSYFDKKEPRKFMEELSPKDYWITHLIGLCVDKGCDIDDIKKPLEMYEGTQKTRLKKQINFLFDSSNDALKTQLKELELNHEINDFLYNHLQLPRISISRR